MFGKNTKIGMNKLAGRILNQNSNNYIPSVATVTIILIWSDSLGLKVL